MSEGGALREIAARFGIEFDDEELSKGVQSIGGAIDRLKEFGQLLAANEFVQRVREFADQFEEDAGRIDDASQTLGLTAGEFQALGYAATQGGLNAEQATASWATLNRNIAAAAQGSKAQADAFRALGVSVKEADGTTRPLLDVAMDMAEALDGIEDPARRASLAQQAFGEGGRRLLTILKSGEGGLSALTAEFGQLGGALDQESIEAAGAYGDEMNRLRVAQDGLRATLATALLPILTGVAQKTREWMVTIGGMLRQSEAAKAALLVLGAIAAAVAIKVLIAWAPVLIPLAKMALIVAAIILVLDDLITTVNGGDSATRRFIDGMLGVGATAGIVRGLAEGWEALKFILSEVVTWGSRVWRELGDNLTYAQRWFGDLFTSIDRWFSTVGDGMFAGIWRSFTSFFRSVGQALMRIPGMSALSNIFGEIGSNIRMAYNLPGGAPQRPSTPGTQAATTRAPAAARTTNVQQQNHTTINVSGAGDPAAVAREVDRRQRETQNAGLRAAQGALTREAG